MKAFYRKIIYSYVALYIMYLALPWLWGYIYSQVILDALSWNGYGSIIDIYGPVPYALAFLLLVSVIGLHQFKKWGRTLFLVATVISGLLSPFFGLAVIGNYDSIFPYFLTVSGGVILSLSYFSVLNSEFK
ncbi:MAG: hypothetical protein Tsb002_13150 [Wenzhouxiangellaceae bacterium]